MEYLPILIAIVIILLMAYLYKQNAKKNAMKAKEDKNYKVPLSDDVQKLYYDNYEKQLELDQQEQQEGLEDQN